MTIKDHIIILDDSYVSCKACVVEETFKNFRNNIHLVNFLNRVGHSDSLFTIWLTQEHLIWQNTDFINYDLNNGFQKL